MRPRPEDDDDVLLSRAFAHERTVFTVCATMVGVCLTAIGLIRVAETSHAIRNLSRIALASDALVFLLGASVSFATLRAHVVGRPTRLRLVGDLVLLLGLVGIVVVCFVLVFTMM